MVRSIQTIAYCDDDEDDHDSFREALNKVQPLVQLHCTKNWDELSALLEETLPDLLFLDINIPHKDGMECLKLIKGDDRLNQLIVIMHSTAQEPYVERCYSLGANLYVPKPLSLHVYPVIMQKVLMLDWNEYVPQPPFKKFLLTYKRI